MNERLKTILSEVDKKGFVALSPVQPSPFDAAFLNTAFEVPPGQSLMHYMRIDRFKTLLTNCAIYMRRLDLFAGDPHEGQFPAANANKNSSLTRGFTEQLGLCANALAERQAFIEGTMRKLTYVHCWFGWDSEDNKMWEEYGDAGRGVCIRTTAQRLLQSLSKVPDLSVELYGVTYSGEDDPVSELISFLAACRKRPQFAHEREVRLIGQMRQTAWDRYSSSGSEPPDFQMVGVDFGTLFERISVGHAASEQEFREVEVLANGAAGSRVVHRSTVSGT